MRIDRPSGRPDDPGEIERPRPPEPVQEDRSRYALRDDNGLTPAEYIREWNKKVDSGQAETEQVDAERPRRDPVMRDADGMTAAELRFERNKRIDEAKAATDMSAPVEKVEPSAEPRRDSVMRDSNGLTPVEYIRQHNRRIKEDAEKSAPEPANEGDEKPEKQREFKTLTEEFGESRTFSTFDAARRASIREHGPRPGQDLHHLVERSQARPERSGFTPEQIHSSDNLGWLDRPVHEKITARYNKGIPGFSHLRDSLDGLPFETQHAFGRNVVDEEIGKYRGDA
ncbi:hypothetical protein [Microlunatus parietis]|uniref:Uncharacterized protein n=1 Tax=Microlunatus parietis TaxID=682979 RepID=A0A7Y9LD44_9ACTN|nr:hypothetical protein [Microlunatus parietis]NYE72508.1 hypothetical protein [Microlunatus parietis]